jgi:hypothetical protein
VEDRPEILEPWDRRAEESDEAFEAFTVYRDLGPGRSIRKVAEALDKSRQTLGQHSSRHDWQDRAAAWDLEVDRQRRLALVEENVRAARRHAQQLQGALQVMSLPILEVMRRIQEDASLLHQLPFPELSTLAVQSARVMPRLVVADRLARGMSTENVEHGGTIEVHRERADRMSEQELDDFLERTVAGQLPPPKDVDAPG